MMRLSKVSYRLFLRRYLLVLSLLLRYRFQTSCRRNHAPSCKAGSLTKELFERNLPKIDGNRQVRGALNDVFGPDSFLKWEQENREGQSSRISRPSDRMREILRLVNSSMENVRYSWSELSNAACVVFRSVPARLRVGQEEDGYD